MFASTIFALLFALATQSAEIPRVEAATLSKDELTAIAMADATAHHLSPAQFVAVIECESHFDISAAGDHNQSFGIAQIYLPAHKDISAVQALSPLWALDWMSKEWEAGRQYEWTCARTLFGYKKGSPPK